MHCTPIAWHVTARLRRSRVIPNSRGVARVVLEHARRDGSVRLLGFSVPDNHVHLLLAGDRDRVGRMVNHLLGGLTQRLDLEGGFSRAWFGRVETQRHLENALHYVHRQHQRHDTAHDPFREASSLPDLLGLRPMGEFLVANVLRELPRTRCDDLVGCLGVQSLQPGSGAEHLLEGASAVIAADDLRGNSRHVVRARQAAAHWGHNQGRSTRWIADHLLVEPRCVRRSLSRDPEPLLLRAIGLQIGLRETLKTRNALVA